MSGFSASSSSREPSMTATQPGPLTTHCDARIALRSMRSCARSTSSVAASTAPLRRSGGAANASRLPSRRMADITRIEAAFGAVAADTDLPGRIAVVEPRREGAKVLRTD